MSVVVIPKSAVLSTRSCALAQHIPHAPYGHDATLTLALALYSEQCVPQNLIVPYGSTLPTVPPIKLLGTGYWPHVLDGSGTSSPFRVIKIGMELHFSGTPPCVILCRPTTLAVMDVEPSQAV
jgi:hypothetical protein